MESIIVAVVILSIPLVLFGLPIGLGTLNYKINGERTRLDF